MKILRHPRAVFTAICLSVQSVVAPSVEAAPPYLVINNPFENGGISATAVRGLVVMDNQSVNSPPRVDVPSTCSEVGAE